MTYAVDLDDHKAGTGPVRNTFHVLFGRCEEIVDLHEFVKPLERRKAIDDHQGPPIPRWRQVPGSDDDGVIRAVGRAGASMRHKRVLGKGPEVLIPGRGPARVGEKGQYSLVREIERLDQLAGSQGFLARRQAMHDDGGHADSFPEHSKTLPSGCENAGKGLQSQAMRVPVIVSPVLPKADDPGLTTILTGLCRATGATGCTLDLHLEPYGLKGRWSVGHPEDVPHLVMKLETDAFQATCELTGAGNRPAARPAVLESLRPLFEAALGALIDRRTASFQLEVLSQILGVSDAANLLIDASGEILFANPRGEEVLALQTLHPRAQIEGDGRWAPLLDLLVFHMTQVHLCGEHNLRRIITIADRQWQLEIIALPGLARPGCCLVVLAPIGLPNAFDLHRRFVDRQISHRESEVMALAVAGRKSAEIAVELGISLYTVKDHLKHAYAKLGVNSRAQLLAMIATAGGVS